MNKKLGTGCALGALFFIVSFGVLSCAPSDFASADVYSVILEPNDDVTVQKGGVKNFNAILKKSGRNLSEPYTKTWDVTAVDSSKHENTAIDNDGLLTVAVNEPSETLLVSVTISYNGGIYIGSLDVTVLNLDEQAIFDAFNAAPDAGTILELLTEQNIMVFASLFEEMATAKFLETYSVLDKTAIAENIIQNRQSSEYAADNQFIDSTALMQAVLNALNKRQDEEASAIVSSLSTATAAQIMPLLTRDNFIILDISGKLWNLYDVLGDSFKAMIADRLSAREFNGTIALRNAITESLFEISFIANYSQLVEKLDTALSGSSTGAQLQDLIDLLNTISGETPFEVGTISVEKLAAYNSLISDAKLGKYGFSAIKEYVDAGVAAHVDHVASAVAEVIDILRAALEDITFGTLTLTDVPVAFSWVSVYIYDASAIPNPQSGLNESIAGGFLPNGHSEGLIVAPITWKAFPGSKARNFVVRIVGGNDDAGAITKIDLINFDANGDATADFEDLADAVSEAVE
ncbi:MAG: hypothetical protein LBD20_08150 [Spirochaetaceae bacterium]|jgi:hypothetical protein|nr:hypothetical protein [Spirochaetaceae bacterium]